MMPLDAQDRGWSPTSDLETPFAETLAPTADGAPAALGFAPWAENASPFEGEATEAEGLDRDHLVAEALEALQDESFDEAVANLVEETEQAVADRFTDETTRDIGDRERFAEARLAEVRYEAGRYLESLEAEVAGLGLDVMAPEQIDEALARFEPEAGEVSPAGEQFVKVLAKKARAAIGFASKLANRLGRAASVFVKLGLQRLRGFANQLLRRVLALAVGRLPAPLQPAARRLASRLRLEAESSEATMSPANLTDVETLTESFDESLAEALVGGGDPEAELEGFAAPEPAEAVESRQLEALADARAALIERLRTASDDEDLTPAIEQFLPVAIGALRLGIRLAGRHRVVGFLARFLGRLIRRWVGPKLSLPLSTAIVDTGLRLVSLESPADQAGEMAEAAPVALAGVIEDTVRRLAESEDFMLEDEALMPLAASEAFAAAVATHVPSRFVRPDLRQAPSLGGTFVLRRPRSQRPFSKYSRVPEVEITEQIAEALPAFGGSTLGAVLRAAGMRFPFRARLHIYQASVGTTIPRMVRVDRGRAATLPFLAVQPLTRSAAGLLLREPALGVDAPADFLRSRHRIAAGQRLYLLEPLGSWAAGTLSPMGPGARPAPSRVSIRVDRRRGQARVALFLSEPEAQRVAEALRDGRGPSAFLMVLARLMGGIGRRGPLRLEGEDEDEAEMEEFEDFGAVRPLLGRLRRRWIARLRRWLLPALAAWARDNAAAFARAASDPAEGVTVEARLTAIPGLGSIGGTRAGVGAARPVVAISVSPGRR